MSENESRYGDLTQRIAALRDTTDYRAEQSIDEITEAIVDRMLDLGLSRAALAERLGVTPARVTNLLRGANNFTVRTLADVAIALDCDLTLALVPREAATAPGNGPRSESSRPVVAAESRAAYGATRPRRTYASRDDEIRRHLASGKLRVEGERIFMRHEHGQAYQPARFRNAGTHSAKQKTNVGRRSYYRDRILAVAREIEGPTAPAAPQGPRQA